jgi:hypothetical protein
MVDVYYSDVQGGQAGVAVEPGCTLNWAAGNISSNPMFTPAGQYYLSQTAAGQSQNSPCVDAGSDYASRFGLHRYTTRTDEIPDKGKVDMGYHYRIEEICLLSDFSDDGKVDFEDFAMFALRWLDEGCSDQDGWCQGRDLTFDTKVNYYDLKDFSDCWLYGVIGPDTTPPTPDPMSFVIPPYATSSTSIAMVATTATDASGVRYEFDETGGGPDSGLLGIPAWTATGLNPNTQYCYRVRAVDRSPRQNATAWSGTFCVTTLPAGQVPDTNAPAPPPTIVFNVDTNTITPDNNALSGQYLRGLDWWHKIVANVAGITDDSGGLIRIRFICLDDESLNSPFVDMLMTVAVEDPGPPPKKWRVTNNGGNLVYDVNVNKYGGIGKTLTWKVCAYDPSDNEACSNPHTIGPPPL